MFRTFPSLAFYIAVSSCLLLVTVGIAQSGMSWNIMDTLPNGTSSEESANLSQRHYKGIRDILLKAAGKGKFGNDYLFIENHFPQGLGNNIVDQQIKKNGHDHFVALKKNIEQTQRGADDDRLNPIYFSRHYYIFKPSDNYVSIVFYYFQSSLWTQAFWAYDLENYNLKSGKQLNFHDIFIDYAKSEPLFWRYFYKKWQEKYESLPTPFTLEIEKWQKNPQNAKDPNHDFSRHILLTGHGLSVIYGPYASGSLSTGTRSLDIAKSDLIKMGADPAIWGQGREKI